jgi:hypothetical protein
LNTGLLALPEDLASASLGGGEALVEWQGSEPNVFFYVRRGVLDSFSGFAYMPGGFSRDAFKGDWKEIIQWAPNWYYARSQ